MFWDFFVWSRLSERHLWDVVSRYTAPSTSGGAQADNNNAAVWWSSRDSDDDDDVEEEEEHADAADKHDDDDDEGEAGGAPIVTPAEIAQRYVAELAAFRWRSGRITKLSSWTSAPLRGLSRLRPAPS